nr:ATP-binding protein [Brevundimonas pishanensis]
MQSKHSYLSYTVSGFRSLNNSKFTLDKGVNVFVGPNGSGKTNIITSLVFLSTYIKKGVRSAISELGGISRVFSIDQLNSRRSRPKISFEIEGRIKTSDNGNILKNRSGKEHAELYADFKYILEISVSRPSFDVFIDNEEISISVEGRPDLDVNIKSGHHAECQSNIELDIYASVRSVLSSHMLERITSKDNQIDSLKTLQLSTRNGASILIHPSLSLMDRADDIKIALSFERSFNIIPDKVREPEELYLDKEISSDGGGTVSYLNRIQPQNSGKRTKKAKPNSKYNRIVTNFTQINDQVKDIIIVPDLRTGKINTTILYTNGTKVPFEYASDGTAKWLATLAIIRSSSFPSFCLEEPENFMHPAAQRLIIKILRSETSKNDNSFYVVSTHSETIVNEADPSELRICEFTEDGTNIFEIRNPDRVKESINSTGFGLGHLYSNDQL